MMKVSKIRSLLLAAAIAGFCSAEFSNAEEVNFNRDIRPILSDRCFHCHGPDEDERKADLRLDLSEGEEGAYRTKDGVTTIKPGDLEASELWYRIITDDEDDVMPPPKAHKKPLNTDERDLIKRWIQQGAKYEKFWAFVPPREAPIFERKDSAPTRQRIDHIVAHDHKQKGLTFNPEADRRTLIRRVTFDLTGLPPSLEEIEQFLSDKSPEAYEKLVDRLLKMPQYGEHMARYWADLVRLADTNGMHKDFYRNFSTYRDWLIRSFNENLPFDDFIKFQLAGDLYDKPTNDQLIASGFNRLHLIIDRGTALPEESHHKNVLDRVEAFGTAFLGLTVQCAQCHDHKYDPITKKDYYQLYAFFNNFDGNPETAGAPRGGIQPPHISVKQQNRDGSQVDVLAMVMKERSEPKPTFILNRGAYDDPGEQVQRGTPAFLPPLKKKDSHYTRMDLAEWLVDPQHPLTARVAVNRFWQQLFGVGLVKTSEDFGAQGQWPSHPELLDDLTLKFVDSGWDVKSLVREIVLSKTYRQSSDAEPSDFKDDPENRNLARGSRYRMDAEMIRDQILFHSGQLNLQMYGQSVKPPQPPGLWKAVSMAAPRSFVADTGADIFRRSFYTYWRRSMPPPQMTIMNAPSREFCVARRERTNTPLQALLLMNEQEYFKAARKCAENVVKQSGGDKEKALRIAYEQITSHEPSAERLKFLAKSLNEFADMYGKDKALTEEMTPGQTGWEHAKRVELAAWTMVVHGLLNLELTKVRR